MSVSRANPDSGPVSRIKYFETPAIQRLLRRVKEGTVTEYRPYFDAETLTVQYTDAQLATELDSEQTRLALELLVDEGILNREPAESYYSCPYCSSKNLQARARCRACESESILNSKGFQHLHCGYKDFESAFVTDRGLVCPKCKESMKALGVDYRKIGVLYRCMECGKVDDDVLLHFACNSCRRRFKQGDAKMELYYVYRFNPDTKERIEKYLVNHEAIRDALEDRGYSAGFEQTITGRSGLPVTVDLAAWPSDGGRDKGKIELISDFAMTAAPLDVDTVRLFISKMDDLEVKKGVILTLHGATEQAQKLAEFRGVIVRDCSGIPSIPEQFESALDEIFRQETKLSGMAVGASAQRAAIQQAETSGDKAEGGATRRGEEADKEADKENEPDQDTLLALMYGKQEQTLKLIKQISQRTRSDFKRLEELLKKLPEAEDAQER
ncbi:MAG: restriction endonuclease [Nitrososphaerota archaeon]|nr:restriction endonuclease [Nitrososphaerota archaeon]